MPSFAERMHAIPPSATVGISDLVARKRHEGAVILSFALGEPDFTTPQHVCDAAKSGLDAGNTHYTPGAGVRPLREAIADMAKAEQGVDCTWDNVIATPAKQAVMMGIQATVGPGDDVLVPDPGWVSYVPAVQWAQANAVPVQLQDETFRMTPESVQEAATDKTKLIILNSPSNPTGGTNTPEDVRGIMELAADNDWWVMTDEIYRKLVYEGKHVSPASIDFERTMIVDGLSKSFAMTGWRTGWVIAPRELKQQIGKLQSHSITHVTSFAQDGMLAAITGPQDSVNEMRTEFLARRRIMVDGLNKIDGVQCPEPSGAFYAFPYFDPEVWGDDDEAVCKRLIEEAGVAGTPGSAFGEAGRNRQRFSYAASRENLQAGLEGIASLV